MLWCFRSQGFETYALLQTQLLHCGRWEGVRAEMPAWPSAQRGRDEGLSEGKICLAFRLHVTIFSSWKGSLYGVGIDRFCRHWTSATLLTRSCSSKTLQLGVATCGSTTASTAAAAAAWRRGTSSTLLQAFPGRKWRVGGAWSSGWGICWSRS